MYVNIQSGGANDNSSKKMATSGWKSLGRGVFLIR